MTSFPDPHKSNDLSIQTPPQKVQGQDKTKERMHNLFMERSFKAQVADSQHFSDSWYGVETRAVVSDLKEKMEPTIPKGAGASVLVCAYGEKPRHLGLGSTSVQGGHPVDINTAAVIGSGAKMFTGLASKILENKGILSLKTKLSDVIEQRHFAIFQDPEGAKDITLEMLLSHTSGLQFHAEISRNDREGMSLDAILDGMYEEAARDPKKKIQLESIPGEGIYSYSNQISLVAVFIEKAYNKAHQAAHPQSSEKFTYADILRREVFEPLGMARTSFVRPEENVLRAYRNDGGIPKSEDADIRDPMHQPAGGLWSTAADIGKLAQAFAKAFESSEGLKSADGKVLLSPDHLEDFLRPRGVYGITAIGIDVVGPFFGKGGEISTYDFKFSFDRETGSYIVSLCNFKNSPEFGGEVEDGRKPGYINQVIPTLDEMHNRLAGVKNTTNTTNNAQETSAPFESLPLHSCDLFFYGGRGIIGMNSKDPRWLNWNGEILPMQEIGKNIFRVTGDGPHAGKEIRLGKGDKGNPYLFIVTFPKTQKVIETVPFKSVQPGSSELSRINEIETMKLQRNLPLKEIRNAQGIYISTKGAEGAPPMTVVIDETNGTIKVSSKERLDAKGRPIEIPMTISSSKKGTDKQLNELWLIGNFMKVPLYQLKLSKEDTGEWMLEVVDFSSKDPVDKMLPNKV
jgi:CubicO group peptidase (beta-lactamase class C family)